MRRGPHVCPRIGNGWIFLWRPERLYSDVIAFAFILIYLGPLCAVSSDVFGERARYFRARRGKRSRPPRDRRQAGDMLDTLNKWGNYDRNNHCRAQPRQRCLLSDIVRAISQEDQQQALRSVVEPGFSQVAKHDRDNRPGDMMQPISERRRARHRQQNRGPQTINSSIPFLSKAAGHGWGGFRHAGLAAAACALSDVRRQYVPGVKRDLEKASAAEGV